MQSDEHDHVIMRSLAQEVTRGGDVSLWPERMMVSGQIAREWSELPEFVGSSRRGYDFSSQVATRLLSVVCS